MVQRPPRKVATRVSDLYSNRGDECDQHPKPQLVVEGHFRGDFCTYSCLKYDSGVDAVNYISLPGICRHMKIRGK